jgi:phosphoribosylaminoimidazole-succinocarboxamide synthase
LILSTAAAIVGEPYASTIASLSIQLYKTAHAYAFERGLILADTKFEFGLDPETNEVVLVDEVLTPDSSRFWLKDKYVVGQGQENFDKQVLRDWLVKEGLKGRSGVQIPEDIVKQTAEKYQEAFERITSSEP